MKDTSISDKEKKEAEKKLERGGTLGTFSGVFTPSILTILGIILFLRLGYVTGSAGVGCALIILFVANVITILTSLSLAAVATNLKVKGGGDYYLISRTLGYRFGGAIGVVLYLAQSVSVAFYCIGFAEAVTSILGPKLFLDPRLVAIAAMSVLFILAWKGADWATRFQYVVMVIVVAALASFFIGSFGKWEYTTFLGNWTGPEGGPPFWILFAVFFPAVTGFTQGVSMSGDLKDSAKSLPVGTFLAVGVSIVIYLVVIITFGGVLPNRILMEDYQAIKMVARYDVLIDAGVIAATLSSAMASFLGGPRILQSLAADRIFPFLLPFAKGAGPTGNPRRAVLLTALIALATISVGQLNLIARIVSMFFLISYGLLNYATYFEADSASPSFRPRFRFFNKYLSLAGSILCLGILLALDMINGVFALAIMLAIYLYLRHTAQSPRWADASRSHALKVIVDQLISIVDSPQHHRDWRPNILAFTKSQERRAALLTFGEWMRGGSGILTAIHIVEKDGKRLVTLKNDIEKDIIKVMRDRQIRGFSQIVQVTNATESLPVVLQSFGIGPLRANTVLLNWYADSESRLPGLQAMQYGHNLRTVFLQGMNCVILHPDPSKWESLLQQKREKQRIDVWWLADNTGRLMLLFAYLMTRNTFWAHAEIRVLTSGTGKKIGETSKELEQLLDEARIPAKPYLVKESGPEHIITESAGSSFVFLPFFIRQSRLTDEHGYSFERTLPQLPLSALVRAAEDIDLDAEPEEGAAGELALALDNLYRTEKRAKEAKKEETLRRKKVENLKSRLESLELLETTEEENNLIKGLALEEKEADKAFRKMAKEAAKAQNALKVVEELGGDVDVETT